MKLWKVFLKVRSRASFVAMISSKPTAIAAEHPVRFQIFASLTGDFGSAYVGHTFATCKNVTNKFEYWYKQ